MGAIKKAIDDAIGKQDEAKIKEKLQLLLVAAKSKIKGYRDDINEQFMNPGQIDKIQIPGIRSLKYIEQYHVASSSGLNKEFGDHLNSAIDAFFSIGDGNNKDSIKSGVKNLISGALDAFIGVTEAGETEEKIYFIVPENNSLIRVDVALWKYHMTDSAIIDNKDTAIAYVLCKSVVDHAKITLDELIYLTSQALSTQKYTYKDIVIYVKDGIEYDKEPTGYDKQNDSQKTVRYQYHANTQEVVLKDPTQDKTVIANWREWIGGMQVPPSISDVEAYLDELIKIWKKLRAEMKEEKNAS